MTYAKKTLSEIKLIHGDFGNFIKGQKLDKRKEKKYKTPPYKDLAASTEIDGEPLDEKCWKGYEKKGMKTMFGKRYPNCVKKKKTRKEEFSDWRSELEEIEEKKMTKAQIKKRDEIADAISTKDMKDRYGDKNVKYAIATKLAMKEDNIQEILDKKDVPHVKKLVKKLRDGSKTHAKQADDLEVALKTENTAIESELVIQDWNSDNIKFTEIETVDIIKAKPLKEDVELDEKFGFLKKAFGKAIILGTGASKSMGKSPRLSRKASISLTTNKALKGFKDAIQKVKDLKNVQKMSDTPPKFPRDKQIIKVKKKINPNAVFPNKANVKIKNEIISDTGISNKNPIKKKFKEEHYDWREDLGEDWQKVNRKDKTDGLSKKAVKAYRRENPGSKLQTAVTKDPKKLKKGSKSAKRRLSFCRRMKGMKKKLTSAKTRRDPDSRINKALRRWNC